MHTYFCENLCCTRCNTCPKIHLYAAFVNGLRNLPLCICKSSSLNRRAARRVPIPLVWNRYSPGRAPARLGNQGVQPGRDLIGWPVYNLIWVLNNKGVHPCHSKLRTVSRLLCLRCLQIASRWLIGLQLCERGRVGDSPESSSPNACKSQALASGGVLVNSAEDSFS